MLFIYFYQVLCRLGFLDQLSFNKLFLIFILSVFILGSFKFNPIYSVTGFGHRLANFNTTGPSHGAPADIVRRRHTRLIFQSRKYV